MNYKDHTHCRVCGSEKLTQYLNLGMMPLSNNLASATVDPVHYEKYPLKVLLCEGCGLSQLSIVIPPDVLFSHYLYRSSISQTFKNHCRDMAIDLKYQYDLNEKTFHIDIAGNDGALLDEFRKILNHRILNIDPALNLAGICEAADIPTLTEFWGLQTAHKIINGGHGKADLITATNVFAHVDDVRDFIRGVRHVLSPTGVLVMEFPYLLDFIEKAEFDTVYFEHLSYFSIYPLTALCREEGLNVLKVEKQDIHGGSVRVHIGEGKSEYTVDNFIINERMNYSRIEPYRKFRENVLQSISNFSEGIWRIRKDNVVAAFAASAKGNTLLNASGIGVGIIKYIVDQTPEKIGKYSPGTHIPIVSMDDFRRNFPDYLVILSWNFADEIMDKCRAAGYEGKFIIPIPEFQIIE